MLTTAFLCALTLVAEGETSKRHRAARQTLREFTASFVSDPTTRFDAEKGCVQQIFGSACDLGIPADAEANLEWMCRALVNEFEPMFGFTDEVLQLRRIKRLKLAALGTTDKTAVIFDQHVDGLPVRQASLTFLFDDQCRLLSVSNHCLPGVSQAEMVPMLEDHQAIEVARAGFRAKDPKTRSVECQMVWSEKSHRPVFAWVVELRTEGPNGAPIQEKFTIDGRTGDVLRKENTIHYFSEMIGRVQGYATPGLDPDIASNPPQLVSLERVHVELFFQGVPIYETETDANGFFTAPPVGTFDLEATVDFNMSSPLVNIVPFVGDPVASTRTMSPDILEEWNLNGAFAERKTSQVNVHYHVMKFVNWIRSIDPDDNTMNFQQLAVVNRNPTCRAYYDGVSTNYDRAGAGCVNMAFSSVIGHEIGHWANDRYGSGNGPDGFGEGNADVFATFLYDDPIIGRDWCGPGCVERTATNNRQYCGTCGAGCYGQLHTDGEPHMGSFWKMRERLDERYGNARGDRMADTLFLAWMNAFDDSQVCTIVRDHLLVLDDDDGELWNGTPHALEIDDSFAEHGYPSRYHGSLPRDRDIRLPWR